MAKRSAFTLIELLVVMAIIATLASITVVLIKNAMNKAKELETNNRLLAINQNLQQAGSADGSAAYQVMKQGLQIDFRWAPMRQIFADLIKVHGIDFNVNPERVPYGTAIYIDPELHKKDPSKGDVLKVKEPLSSFALDDQVGFGVMIKVWVHSKDKYYGDDLDIQPSHSTKHRYNYPMLEYPAQGSYDFGYVFRTRTSSHTIGNVGENLDLTQEVYPTEGDWERQDYLDNWPTIDDSIAGDVVTINSSWPDSDWTADPIGTIDPIWPWPWGQRMLTRSTHGEPVPQKLERDLSELSPLHTITLLQYAGILKTGSDGEDDFRGNRNRERPWNDRHGNPLIVVNASFIAPRYGYQANETWRDARGGRDLLMKKARATYGYARSVYLASGALGERRRDYDDDIDFTGFDGTAELPDWTAADDATVLRLSWMQIREVCQAADWDEDAWDNPAWEGVREREQDKCRSSLTAPFEIK